MRYNTAKTLFLILHLIMKEYKIVPTLQKSPLSPFFSTSYSVFPKKHPPNRLPVTAYPKIPHLEKRLINLILSDLINQLHMQSRYLHQPNSSQGLRVVSSSALRSQAQQLSQQSDLPQASGISSAAQDSAIDNRYKLPLGSGYTMDERSGIAKKEDFTRPPGESTFSRYTAYDRSHQNTATVGADTTKTFSSLLRPYDFSSSSQKPQEPFTTTSRYTAYGGPKSPPIPEVTINLNQGTTTTTSNLNQGTTTSNLKSVSPIGSSSLSSSVYSSPYASHFKTAYQTPGITKEETESKQKFTVAYPGATATVQALSTNPPQEVGQPSSAWSSRFNYTTLTANQPTPTPSLIPAVSPLPYQPQPQPTTFQSKKSPIIQPQSFGPRITSEPTQNINTNEISIDIPRPPQISPIKIQSQILTKAEMPTELQINTPEKEPLLPNQSKISIQKAALVEESGMSTSRKKQAASKTYDLFETERKINPPRFASESVEKFSEIQKLREENRILNRELINLRVVADNGRSCELEMARSENKQLRDQIVSLKIMHEEKLNDAMAQIQRLKTQHEQFRNAKQQQNCILRMDAQNMFKKINQLREVIDRLQLQKHEQPKDLVGLRQELARWQDQCQNTKLQHRVAIERNTKFSQQVQTYKTLIQKGKASQRSKDAQINTLHQKRVELQGQIVQLNNKLEIQKAEKSKALGKHADYEKQITTLKSQIEGVNKIMQTHITQKNELNNRVSEMKAERKNLLEFSRRSSMTEQQESKMMEERNSLLEQLKEKVDEIGELKNRIAEMAAQMNRQRDLNEVTGFKERIAKLELDNEKLRKFNKNPAGQFDEVLKSQLTQTQRYKQNINQKTEEIYRLRQQVNSARSQIDQLLREKDVETLKQSVQKKNLMSQFKIERQALQTQMEVIRKAVKMQEEKAKHWALENRKKDEFMQNYLIGRTKPEEDRNTIREFFRNYQTHIPSFGEYA